MEYKTNTTDQWNIIRTPETNYTYMFNSYMTREPRIRNGEETVSSKIYVGKTGQLHVKE